MEKLIRPKYNFEDIFPLHVEDVTRLTPTEAYRLRIGDIALIRSVNVPELGNHFIVVTGHPVEKPHGVRPQVVSIAAGKDSLIEKYSDVLGLTALKLNEHTKVEFMNFYGIALLDGFKISFSPSTIEEEQP